ncbi:MAG: helix-turn-helix domain-containing protein [Bacillota bacterium]|nr:helix-turn-helix domain-containing protein [Bacillota bacterium]
MDTVKIGRFIADCRKSLGFTQIQLADALCISDKTVSKWECGKGLPEVSLMLPLCEKLKISVNDLLSGERVTGSDYQKKAEENMMNLMKENEENKKRFWMSVVCGVITIIAVGALIVIASFIDMATIYRILIILFAAITAALGIGTTCVLDVKAGYFECPHCKELFIPTTSEYVKGYHTFTKRKLTCPKCGKSGMCKKRITR